MLANKRSASFATAHPKRFKSKSYRRWADADYLKLSLLLVWLMGCAPGPVQGQAPRSPTPASANRIVQVQSIAKGLEHPWGLEFLPDKRMLVTERPGRLRLVGADGRVSEQSYQALTIGV